MTKLVLAATSRSDDLGFQALSDIAIASDQNCRVIGGHMVTLHVWRHGLNLDRVTNDADLGVKPFVARSSEFVVRLKELGYRHVKGNRFMKTMPHLATINGVAPDSIIDVLVPSYTSRARNNVKHGEIVTTEVPGLATAMQRPFIECDLSVTRLDGQIDDFTILIPDELASLVLKTLARRVRDEDKDAVDVWRCLECCAKVPNAQLTPDMGIETDAAKEILRDQFVRNGVGSEAAAHYRNLSDS